MQVRCVSNSRGSHVDFRARLSKRGQRCRNHHGSHISNQDGCRVYTHAHALQNVRQRLGGEDCLAFVPRAIQADDQSIAHELVIPHSFERNQFLQARAGRRRL